jgi:hypothetical protein
MKKMKKNEKKKMKKWRKKICISTKFGRRSEMDCC